ncbi:MAG TPA: PqqD family protein [Myxococcales bacterium]|nr:PqqD family protein [Myxococcales bacterium]
MGDWMEAIPRVHPETGVERVGGRLLALGPDDHLHSFEDEAGAASEVAERIVELSDGTRTLGRIIDELCEEFDVARDACAHDAVEFVKLLTEKKVLVLEPGARAARGD